MKDWSGEDHLSEITAETLILWGEGDRTYRWPQTELLLQSIPGSHLAAVPDCAHAIHLERPEFFNRLIVEFLGYASSEHLALV